MDTAKLEENIGFIRQQIREAALRAGRDPKDVHLCAAGKTQPSEVIRASAKLDIDLFGENRMQEMRAHMQADAYLGKPVHFIGHLQTNKVRQVVGKAAVIESVGSLRLLDAIDAEAAKQGMTQNILIEINLGKEPSKAGIFAEDLRSTLEQATTKGSVHVLGLMAIPPVVATEDENRDFFASLRELSQLAKNWNIEGVSLDVLSMGMSDSYVTAIEEGATHVRIGRGIFGERVYQSR